MLKGFRSRRPVPSPLSTCATSCASNCTTIRPTMMSVNARAWPRNLPSSLALNPVGCFEHITCFCTMTPSPLTCQPKLSKGFRQLPFLDTQISSIITTWLRDIMATLELPVLPGVQFTGHSLRRGGASVAHAINVSLPRIMARGLWSDMRTAISYIDISVMPSDAAWFFFGNLIPNQGDISPPLS